MRKSLSLLALMGSMSLLFSCSVNEALLGEDPSSEENSSQIEETSSEESSLSEETSSQENSDEEGLYLPRPEAYELAFWLGDPYEEDKLIEHTYIPGWFGAKEYLDKHYAPVYSEDGQAMMPEIGVSYLFSGYPDVLDEVRLTRIKISDPSIQIYGLTLGSEEEEIDEVLAKEGYTKGESEIPGRLFYSLGRFSFIHDGSSIIVSSSTSNIHGIIY